MRASSFLLRALVALVFAGCGSRTELGSGAPGDAGALAFPVGTYTSCATGVVHEDSNNNAFLTASGFEPGASLTLAQSGDVLTATYADMGSTTYAFDFEVTTSTSAVLAPAPQVSSGFGNAICAFGVGVSNEKFYPSDVSADAGALTYESGTVFVSLEGRLESNTDCGVQSSPASVWLVCGDGPSQPPVDSGAPPAVQLPVGQYACSSQIGTHGVVGGMNEYVSGGGSGTLVLTLSGAGLTAQYSGDPALSGALHLTLTTATTANADPDQSLTAPCALSGAGSDPPGALPIAAGSLMVDGSTVFLSFSGIMGASSSCAGAQKAGSVICSKK